MKMLSWLQVLDVMQTHQNSVKSDRHLKIQSYDVCILLNMLICVFQTGDIVYSYSVITLDSSPTMSWIHHRMPVCITL